MATTNKQITQHEPREIVKRFIDVVYFLISIHGYLDCVTSGYFQDTLHL